MGNNDSNWFYKGADGAKAGPLSISDLRALAVDGTVSADTPVSPDGKQWQPAVSVDKIGFDCLVLQTRDGFGVLGPFAREYLDQPDALREIPSDGLFFVRSGTVADAASLPSPPIGETGASLVGRVLAAENALRESERARSAAEASLRARDLEFDAERQRLNAEISSLKAAAVKASAELESAREEARSRAKAERSALDAAARTVDCEKRISALQASLDAAEKRAKGEAARADAAEKRAKGEAVRADAAEKRAKGEAVRADAAEKRAEGEAVRADAAVRRAETLAKLRSEIAALIGKTQDEGAPLAATTAEEPIVVVEPAPEKAKSGASSSDASRKRGPQGSPMAALENQLRHELNKMASAPDSAAREGLSRLFRKK